MFDSVWKSDYNNYQMKPNKRKEAIIVKSTGIVRKVDELGRIVLPIELRRNLDIEERDSLEIYMDGERIILQKYEATCIFCGAERELLNHKGKNVCANCIRILANA